MKALVWLGRVHDGLTDLGYVLGAAALLTMAGAYCYEVVLRYFLDAPTRWASITVAHLLLITVFLLMPHVTRAGGHVAVNLIFQFLPGLSHALRIGINLVGFAICALAAWMSLGENVRQYIQMIDVEGIVTFPKWWASVFITFGFASSAVWFLRLIPTNGAVRPRLGLIPHAHVDS